jgi:hypothetical protein
LEWSKTVGIVAASDAIGRSLFGVHQTFDIFVVVLYNTKQHQKTHEMPQHATPTTLGLKYTTPVMVHCCRASAVDQN